MRILRMYSLQTWRSNSPTYSLGSVGPFKLPAGARILFDRKSDRYLRLCVDYRGFNNLTIKNQYRCLRLRAPGQNVKSDRRRKGRLPRHLPRYWRLQGVLSLQQVSRRVESRLVAMAVMIAVMLMVVVTVVIPTGIHQMRPNWCVLLRHLSRGSDKCINRLIS